MEWLQSSLKLNSWPTLRGRRRGRTFERQAAVERPRGYHRDQARKMPEDAAGEMHLESQ